MEARELICRFGTEEQPVVGEPVVVGDLAFVLAGGALAELTWRGIEVVRAINCLVRDEDWGTYLPQAVDEARSVDSSSGAFTYRRRFSVAEGGVSVEFAIVARPEGELLASAALTAHRDFVTNRAGLTLLHPIEGVAGTGLRVTHPDGATESLEFPRLISPGQPVFAITALAHEVRGVKVAIEFSGEVFEMEDQRNWSDASFKTYCRPLGLPRPYPIARGETVRQAIRVRLSGRPAMPARSGQAPASGRMPDLMLAAATDWLPGPRGRAALARLGADTLLARIEAETAGATTDPGPFAELARDIGAGIDLEVVVRDDISPLPALRALAAQCAASGLVPRHVIALPQAYLKSFQPTDPAPAGATPEDCLAALRAAFPASLAGAGMLTNFTEFNRRRPPPGQGDYVTHGSMATAHAAADVSVLETLAALAQMFDSGRHVAGTRPYRLGLVSIGMRSNPYGAGLVANPQGLRRTMADRDPRQRGLFAAAYAIGVAAASALGGVQAIALAAPVGPFGVMEDSPGGLRLFPIFHALRALAALSGNAVTVLPDLAAGVVGIRDEDGHVVVANCSLEPRQFRSPSPLAVRVLDCGSFAAAASDADWLGRSPSTRLDAIELQPCACLFATA